MPPELARGFTREDAPKHKGGPDEEVTVVIADENTAFDQDGGVIDPGSGALKVEISDGGVVVDLHPRLKTKKKSDAFDANLADEIAEGELLRIASDLIQAIEADDQSRQEWLETRARGIDLLGFKLEQPRGDTGASSAPIEGMSTVRHPILTEAVIRFQSNASAELLPAGGPVKVRDDSPIAPANADQSDVPGFGHNGGPPLADMPPGLGRDDLAMALESDLNHYLTSVDRGYRADTDRMLFWVGFGGAAFKKVHHCPIRRMPLSRSVDARDLIVANSANDIEDAGRVTHRIQMRKSTLIRMQLAGVYRQVEGLTMMQPQEQPNAVDQKIAAVQGFAPSPTRPEDNAYTVYESYVELDIAGFEHKNEDGDPSGLELPYRVTIEKDTQKILEIRRNWEEDDENCIAKRVFVKYPFIPAFGFYDIGLLQILGNATKALTTAWREMLDAGMYASFPGFLYSDVAGRQLTNEFRVPPGGGQRVQTGGRPVQEVIMPLPYKDVTPGLSALVDKIEVTGQRVGGTAELQVGEGKQDAPVGTTLALIEQATKMLAAVHIRLHAAQSEEFQLLKQRFREDPGSFWRHNKRPAHRWEVDQFLAALDDFDIVPAADPNTSSHMQRIMKAVAVKQLQAANPTLYNGRAVDLRILRDIGVADAESLLNTPEQEQAAQAAMAGQQGQGADPAKMTELQLKAEQQKQKAQSDMQKATMAAQQAGATQAAREKEVAVESSDRAADRESRERVAQIREQTEQLKSKNETAQHQTETHADLLGQHLDSQADLAKHQQGLAADAQNQHLDRQAGLQSEQLQAGLERGGVVAEHHKHARQLEQEDRHHQDEMAGAAEDRDAQAKAAEADREVQREAAKAAATAKKQAAKKPAKSPKK